MTVGDCNTTTNGSGNNAQMLLPAECHEAAGLDEVSSSKSCMRPGSPLACTFTLSCVSLGVGVFAMPGQFAAVGLTTGTVLLVISALFANIALLLLCQLTDRLHVESLEELCYMAMGRVGKATASIFFIITCLIGNAAHLLVVSDMGRRVLQYWVEHTDKPSGNEGWQYNKWQRATVIGLLGLAVMPFCWTHFINNLRFLSTASVCWVIATCAVCIGMSIQSIANDGFHNMDAGLPDKPWDAVNAVIKAGGAIAFAFSSILSFFPVHKEATNKKVMYVNVNISTVLCMAFYLVVALLGALAHDKVADTYLDQLPCKEVIVQIALVGLSVVIVLLYPVVNFPLVRGLDNLLFNTDEPSTLRLRIYSVLILGAIVALDSVLPCASTVFSIGGGLGLGMLSYGLPGICYMALCTKSFVRDGQQVQRKRNIPLNILAFIIACYGIILAAGTVYNTMDNAIHNPDGKC